ncbi:MAG: response regulator transcription factor [Lachnospiraceae bacterium]|nr:response regulator transcription factor [Lachnospiraceae bacterium]
MEIAIVGDEEFIQEQVCSSIKSKAPACQAEVFATGEDFLAAGHKFDLAFLDIQLGGMNGIEAARIYQRQQEDAVLVFLADSREYAYEAFDVSAFDYLLKPIEEQKFMEVFGRAVKEAAMRRGHRQDKILIRAKGKNFTVHREDILYIENRGKKVEIHIAESGEIIEIYATMEELTRKLGEGFYRCHRGYLVNMAHIAGYGADSISLGSGEEVCLSKKRHSGFVKRYMQYLQKEGGEVV